MAGLLECYNVEFWALMAARIGGKLDYEMRLSPFPEGHAGKYRRYFQLLFLDNYNNKII